MILRQGYLRKRGASPAFLGRHTWSRRWFVLTEDSLLYMLSSRDYGRTPPRGLFNLSNIFRISAVQEQSARRRRKFEFQVHSKERTLLLRADTEEEMQGWCKCLEDARRLQDDRPKAVEPQEPKQCQEQVFNIRKGDVEDVLDLQSPCSSPRQANGERRNQGFPDLNQHLAQMTLSSIGDDDEEALSSQYATSSQLDDDLAYERSTPGRGTPNHASNTSCSNISSPTESTLEGSTSLNPETYSDRGTRLLSSDCKQGHSPQETSAKSSEASDYRVNSAVQREPAGPENTSQAIPSLEPDVGFAHQDWDDDDDSVSGAKDERATSRNHVGNQNCGNTKAVAADNDWLTADWDE